MSTIICPSCKFPSELDKKGMQGFIILFCLHCQETIRIVQFKFEFVAFIDPWVSLADDARIECPNCKAKNDVHTERFLDKFECKECSSTLGSAFENPIGERNGFQ